MPEHQLAQPLKRVLRRLGSARPGKVLDELDESDWGMVTIQDVEAALQNLVEEGFLESNGDGYRLQVATATLPGAGELFLACNDPDEIEGHVHTACEPHAEVTRHSLESTFRALVASATEELQVVSAFVDVNAINRFLPEFRLAFQAGAKFTLVTRGVLKREGQRRDDWFDYKVQAIDKLWSLYKDSGGDPAKFRVTDFIRYRYEGPEIPFDPTRMPEEPPDAKFRQRSMSAGVHQKIIVVDRKLAYIGSGEFRNYAFSSTGEAGILLHGPAAAATAALVDCYATHGVKVAHENAMALLEPEKPNT